ncbi:trypsin-like peptidase domain-containing protein [Nocardioides sp.]|uniref:S1C family serine protease n=1 Tax=Nocardioides sp. TaxID=35761 RepID=UPI003527B491
MPRPVRGARLLLSALACLLALSLTAPALADDGSTDPSPSTTPTVSNATILAAKAYPGVQLIATTYTATVSVQVPVINQAALTQLAQRIATQAVLGTIDTSDEAITEAIVDAVVKSPNTYFLPGPRTYSRRNSLTGVGTGWAITPDGYMITAAHVVRTARPELRRAFAVNRLNKLGQQFVRGLQNSGTRFTPDQVERLRKAILGWLAAHLSVTNLNVKVAAELAVGFDGLGKDQRPIEAEVVDIGKPYPGSDIALLKIDGQEHLPTIEVGSNDDVSPGSTVHVVGFPAASTFLPSMSRDAQVQPTVTEGPVTAVKSTSSGMPVFQTQAPASPGNSGGPVLTDRGSAVGVLVASAVGSDGVAAQGQNFVIPASEVQDMLERNGVTPERSDTTATYDQAVDEFYADHFEAALPLFEKVETLYPAHPFAQKFITDSKTAIDEGRDRTPAPAEEPGVSPLLLGGVGAALLLLLAGGGLALWMRGRQRAAAGPAYPGGEAGAGPGAWMPPASPPYPSPAYAAPAEQQPAPVEVPAAAPAEAAVEAPTAPAAMPTSPPPQPVWDPDRGWYLPETDPSPESP